MSRAYFTKASQHAHIGSTIRDGPPVGGVRQDDRMERWRLRQVANALNGSTLLGLAVARAGGARVSAGARGVVVAPGFRLGFPVGGAFPVGNVVATRHDRDWLDERP